MNNDESLIKVDSALLAALSSHAIQFNVFSEDILVLETVVAGTSFRDLSKVNEHLENQIKLEVKREADNKYDPFAVSLYFGETKIGYLPKTKNETIARLLDAGKSFFAQLSAKEWEGTWLRLEIKVYLND
jgi:hypothetical protein